MKKAIKTNKANSYPAKYAWLGLAAVYMGFLSVGLIFHFLPPILPVVINDLGISHGQAGLLMSLFALPGILLSLPGGWLVDRYGERLVGSLGVVLMGAGTVLLGLAPTFTLILLARVLSGIGAMVGVVALQRLVIRLFAGRGLGLPVGVSGSAVPVGIIIILNTAGSVAEASGWRLVALRAGAVTMSIGVVFAVVTWLITRGQDLGREAGQDEVSLVERGASFRPIWIAGAVWFCANGAMTAFMTFAPDHFQGLGFSVSARGLFTSIPMWTSAALGMVTGWLTDRYGGRAVFMALGMALMGTALMVLPTGLVSPSLIGLLLGLSLAAVVTPTIALPGALLPSSHTGRGYGILATCANLGIFVVPPVAGWSRDLSGGYLWPFLIMGTAALVGVVAAEVLRRGHFMPGLSRRAVVVVSLLLLVGCGSQDRYELTVPVEQVADVGEPVQAADLTLLLSSYGDGVHVADAWSAADFVVGGSRGRVIRLQGDLCTDLHLPANDLLVGLLCRPDGSLLAATADHGLWEWSAGNWTQWPALPASQLRTLTTDHLGRIMIQGGYLASIVWRLESGSWQQVADDGWGCVDAIWAEPGQETWLVTQTHNILGLGASGAAVREDSLGITDLSKGSELVGDGSGNLAYTDHSGALWLREAGHWIQWDGPGSFSGSGLFWSAGRLFGSSGWANLSVLENGTWQPVQEDIFSAGPLATLPVSGGQLLIRRDTSGYLFDGQRVQPFSPVVFNLSGLVEFNGEMLAQASSGDIFRIEDATAGIWRHLGRTGGLASDYVKNTLAVDDRGRLVSATEAGLEEWDGTSFSRLLNMAGIRLMQREPDGEILFAVRDGRVGSLRGGLASVDRFSEQGSFFPLGLWRRSPTVIDVLTSSGLYEFPRGGVPVLQWSVAGWEPYGLQELSPERAVFFGYHDTRLVTGDEVVDIGPWVSAGAGSAPVTLVAVHPLANEGLLAWSRHFQTFMRRDELGWHEAAPAGIDINRLADSWSHLSFVENDRQELFFFGRHNLIRLESAGGAW